ncbi:MAG: alanine--tRNA ligase [Candidatus Limnocylindrales bacterium]|jgi:alanyl-tRNA synthetase
MQDQPIPYLTAAEVRRRFVDFFARRGHTEVASASLVPAGDQTLLFTNSGMVQFKDVLTGREKRSYVRATDYQRCLRVAGKHNDFEEVGRTPRHHTFFEMLGNWSFGDYFKREAIHWAWELLTKEFGIPGDRLAATVYSDDDEAYDVWHDEIGLPPERIARWGNVEAGDDANFWRMAETGPCGRCSEIHFDRGAEFSEGLHCVPDHSEHCPRWLEVWNLVFMEFEQRADGTRVPLPMKSVDTGLGLERLTSVIQGVATNYDTDLFTPIHGAMRDLLGHDPEAFEAERFSYQVIADHSRAVTFLVADGVAPSNEGRGYVLRRILRRAVRHGRLLGRREPFMDVTTGVVIDVMMDAYPYLAEQRDRILRIVRREETQFARTLEAGTSQLEAALMNLTTSDRVVGRRPGSLPDDAPVLPGETAFRLHDTYGFPVDLTVDMAAEHGVRVDREGFAAAMAEQKERSRRGTRADLARHAELGDLYQAILRRVGETRFLGYEATEAEGRVVAILRDGVEYGELTGRGEAEVILDATPFYGEGGGQVGDRGDLTEAGGGSALFSVGDTQKPIAGLLVHRGELHGRLKVGQTVTARVDAERRARIMRNHTATHLLHRALRNVMGAEAHQAGSLVAPEYLRFDYPLERALTLEEKRAIEDEVRRIVRENHPVTTVVQPMAEAMAAGADAFFDEKYGERVRTVRVEGYSLELCGGTHCSASGQIGGFVITADRSIGVGMRRIEAVTGDGADALVRERLALLDRLAGSLGATSVEAAPERAAALQEELREARRRVRAGGGGIPKAADLVERAEEVAPGVRLVAYAGAFETPEQWKGYVKEIRAALGSGVIAVALDADSPQIFVTVSPDLVERGISAGGLVKVAMKSLEGRGGGRPEMAQGMGTRRAGLGSAMAAIADTLSRQET